MNDSSPTVFIGLGVQKAGTTWLHDYLMQHPQVRVPKHRKELGYWTHIHPTGVGGSQGPKVRLFSRAKLRRKARQLSEYLDSETWNEKKSLRRAMAHADERSYLRALIGNGKASVVGEISPEYALLPSRIFSQMMSLAEDVRFIILLRDPVRRTLSSIRMGLQREGTPVESATVTREVDECLGGDRWGALERSRYKTTFRELDMTGIGEKLGVFFYETLFNQSEVDRITSFLGVCSYPADVKKRVFKGAGHDVQIAPEDICRLRAALDETYVDMHTRFGDAVPQTWESRSYGVTT